MIIHRASFFCEKDLLMKKKVLMKKEKLNITFD